MGEAKRRHKKEIGDQTQYLDLGSGELRPAKEGGDLGAYLAPIERGEKSPVPCNGCVTCCYHEHVDVDPEKERQEDFAHLLTEPHPDGGLQLQHQVDGACIHLGESGCAIYEHRPQACRAYDCRLFSPFGVADGMAGGRHTPTWLFTTSSRRGHVLQQAHFLAGMLTMAEFKKTGEDWDAA